MNLNASEKVKWLILHEAGIDVDFNSSSVNEAYDNFPDDDENWETLSDATELVRSGGEKSNIPSEYSRHYESQSRAAQLPDGSWVGWTYWYGGGKHGCPDEVAWIEHAYDLIVESEIVRIEKVFKMANAEE